MNPLTPEPVDQPKRWKMPELNEKTRQRISGLLWRGKVGPAFWTVTGVISLIVNAILIAVIVGLAGHLFTLKQLLSDQLLGGLYENFALMDQASISTTVSINTTIPVEFDLPVKTKTTVTLTEDTQISNATVNIETGVLSIRNAPTRIILPAGTVLPIALNIKVPVSTTVPVVLQVPVNIPLAETELHKPFVGLQQVVSPYMGLLDTVPDSWAELLCGAQGSWLCQPANP